MAIDACCFCGMFELACANSIWMNDNVILGEGRIRLFCVTTTRWIRVLNGGIGL